MMFTPHALDPWLDDPHLRAAVATQATVTSTNTVLKHAVQNNSTVPQILIAGEQTAGVGRHGKHFASPADAGLYLSYAFHPQISQSLITPAAGLRCSKQLKPSLAL